MGRSRLRRLFPRISCHPAGLSAPPCDRIGESNVPMSRQSPKFDFDYPGRGQPPLKPMIWTHGGANGGSGVLVLGRGLVADIG